MENVAREVRDQSAGLLERAETIRLDAARKLDATRRAELGQFLTPPTVANLMAGMFLPRTGHLRFLDPGAGVGSLTVALVRAISRWRKRPEELHVVAYEIDDVLVEYLREALGGCAALCRSMGIKFTSEVRHEDFIVAGARMLRRDLFTRGLAEHFDGAILNPPYCKINVGSPERLLLSSIGIETSNLYAAFVALAMRMLKPAAELCGITPRSFCNGVYFRPFRQEFVRTMALRRIHVFESRKRAFADNDVLQENVIVHAAKGVPSGRVLVTSTAGPDDRDAVIREVDHTQVVRPDDPDLFIHVVPDESNHLIGEQVRGFEASLVDLSLNVSTGRVVDFRARELLRETPGADTAPLIYPAHFDEGVITWPNATTRKPNAIALQPAADDLLVPADFYVLVKRFSAKEERRRIVAAVYDPRRVPGKRVGFENHLNYFHQNGSGLPRNLAWGLAAFLNSTLVDAYFRQFSGHTQVNATDLRSLRYPSVAKLSRIGERVGNHMPPQDELDHLIAEEVGMPDGMGPVQGKKKIEDTTS